MITPARQPQRKAARRDQILAAAHERFAEEGIGAVTMGDIAAAAGVSPGNLYYWFRDKSDLVHALFEAWSEESKPAVSANDSAEDVLAFLWNREIVQERITARYGFFARDLLPLLYSDPVLRDRYRANYQAGIAAMRILLERVIDAGLIRPDVDLDSLLRLGWIASELGGAWAQIVDSSSDSVRHARALLSLALTPAGLTYLENRS